MYKWKALVNVIEAIKKKDEKMVELSPIPLFFEIILEKSGEKLNYEKKKANAVQCFPIDCSGRWLIITVHLICLLKHYKIAIPLSVRNAYVYW